MGEWLPCTYPNGFWHSWYSIPGNCCPIDECHMGCYCLSNPGFYSIVVGFVFVIIIGLILNAKQDKVGDDGR